MNLCRSGLGTSQESKPNSCFASAALFGISPLMSTGRLIFRLLSPATHMLTLKCALKVSHLACKRLLNTQRLEAICYCYLPACSPQASAASGRRGVTVVQELTVKIHGLYEAHIVGMRAVQAQEVCRNILIVAQFQHHAHMHLMPLNILDTPCTTHPSHHCMRVPPCLISPFIPHDIIQGSVCTTKLHTQARWGCK